MMGNSYKDLRLFVQHVVESLKGKWGSRRTVEQRRGTLPGVRQIVGNERLYASCSSWHLYLSVIVLVRP
jgi:hypothetical protein